MAVSRKDFRPLWVHAHVHDAVKGAAGREGKTLSKFMEDYFCKEEPMVKGGRGERFRLF